MRLYQCVLRCRSEVGETRQEETHRGATTQHRKRGALFRFESPDAFISGDQRTAFGEVVFAAPFEGPGVETDRNVVGEEIRAGEVEVDDAGEFPLEEEGVVGKEIAMNRAPGQSFRPVVFKSLKVAGDLRGESR